MRNKTTIPLCPSCGGTHDIMDVKFLNIEEDLDHNDLLTFVCPISNEESRSSIYRS